MSFELVDYHCHLDLYADFEGVINECERNKVHTLAVTTTPKAFPKNFQLASSTQFVRVGLGLHPQLIGVRVNEISIWQEYFNHTRYIGEIGLDAGQQYYRYFEDQKLIFKTILDTCAQSSDRILSIHSVRTAPIILDMLERSSVLKKNKAVLHWFSGTNVNLKKAVELGCFFSVNLPMILNDRSKHLVKAIPMDRLLTETDGPFTMIGQNPSRPKDVSRTVAELASLLNQPVEEMAAIILNNLKELEV